MKGSAVGTSSYLFLPQEIFKKAKADKNMGKSEVV